MISGVNFGATQGSSTVSFNGANLSAASWSDTAIVVVVPSGATSGPLSVSVSGQTSNNASFAVTPLPTNWTGGDLGSVGTAGSSTYSNGTFTVSGSGSGIQGTSDGMRFVSQSLSGDGTIIARIVSLTSSGFGQAGVMVRETLDAGAASAFAYYYDYNSNMEFSERASTGANVSNEGSSSGSPPYWVKLVRSGNTFSAYASRDGRYWVQIGTSQTITMAQNVYIGLAVSSQNNSVLATATFDNLSISSTAAPAPAISSLSATTGAAGAQVLIAGSGFGTPQGGSEVTLNGARVTVEAWGDAAIIISIPTGATSGNVVVTVAPSLNSSNPVFFTVTSQPLPNSWLDEDIGSINTAGSTTYASGTFTVNGSGPGINSSEADALHFVYQPLSGDGTITARLMSATGEFAQAGVVILETQDAQATEACLCFSGNSYNIYFEDLTSSGGNVSSQGQVNVPSLPYWMRLVRSGDSFTAYTSVNGFYWVQVGSAQTITMAQDVYIGLYAASGNSTLTTATFDNVSITSASTPAPVISSISATTASVGSQVMLSGSGFGTTEGNSVVLLNGSSVTTGYWSDTSIIITIPTGASSGTLVVAVAPDMNDSNPASITVTSQPLLTPWLDQDIGPITNPGSATYASGTFTVNGSGTGISSGEADALHFVYQPLTGDGTITARLVSVTGEFAQAGLVIRETQNSEPIEACVCFNGYLDFNDRTTTGGNFNSQGQVSVSLPYWVKLVRSGSTFSAYYSPDGSTWTQIGTTQTFTMAQNTEIGLFTNSGNSSLASATFDNVSVVDGTTPLITGLSPELGTTSTAVTVVGSNFGATQGSSTVTFNGVAATSVSSWSTGQIVAAIPSGATTGAVAVTVNSIQSVANPILTIVNPVISSVTPPASSLFGRVTIAGTGFGTIPGQVKINGTVANATSWSDTSITIIVSDGTTSGSLTVTETGIMSNSVSFTILSTLSVTTISPGAGAAGASVTITGTGFGSSQSTSTASFGSAQATIASWSNTSITAIVPSGATTGSVSVEVAGETAYGPTYEINSTVQLTDSLSHTSSYTAAMVGGKWSLLDSSGTGCASCTVRGSTANAFDNYGNVTAATDPRGNVTSYAYDSNGDVTSVAQPAVGGSNPTTTYTYNNFGEVVTMTDPLGHVTSYTYDAHGNLTSVTAPAPGGGAAASVANFAYNSLGELTQITDPLGRATTIAYTSAGLIYTITDPQSHVTTYGYDPHGNRTSITDALSHQTTFAYDSGDRLTTITYPDNSTTTFTYDYRGRRTSTTDQNGKTTTFAYDDADRLTSTTDALSHVTHYSYDTENNLTSIEDASGHTTSFTYDALGRVTQTTFPSSLTESYGYDNDNNLISKTDRKSQTIQYVYDALNRLTQKTYPDSTSVAYTYDLIGKITQLSDPTGTYGLSYDNMGRLTGTTTQYSFLSGTTFTNAYSYDANSNRTGFTAPDSSTSTYSFDTLNRLSNLTNSWAGSFGFSYDALSRRTQMTRPNGVTTNYSYDNLSHLLSALHQLSGSTIDGASYTVDSAGNRTAKTDQLASVTTNYGYDYTYQLLQATQGGTTTESYTYDSVGNRLSSLGVSSYTNNSSNELTGNSSASFTYDYNGNTTSKSVSSATTDYAWDYENRMTSVTLPGSGGTVSFKYNPFGRRIEKISPNATGIFVYDGDNLVETVNATGSTVARYTQGPNIDEPLAMQRGTTTDYYEQDGLGSITSLSSSTGTIAQSYTYDSFGNTTNSSGSVTNFFRYTAREFDTESNLYYDRARYLDQATGRFINEDRIRFLGLDQNLYRYVWNSVPNFRDPRGLIGVGATLNVGGFGGASPAAAGGSVSVGGLFFPDPSGNGSYLSYGGFAGSHGLCRNYQNNQTGGLSAGAGPGFVFTNANSISEVSGPFNNTEYAVLGLGISFAYSPSNGIWTLNITAGYGTGLGFSQYGTNTITNPVSLPGSGCSCSN